MHEVQCTEIWGGIEPCDVSVKLAGARGEVWSRPWGGDAEGGDIHFLSVCGMSILSKIVLADVSGHGAEIAHASRVIHRALNENVGAHDNSAMLSSVNAAFLDRHQGEFRFSTMVSMILDTRDRSLVYAYAGHPAILRGRDGVFRRLLPEDGPRGGVPIGVLPGTAYQQHTAQLEKGDVLVIYTDAFTEARLNGEMLGEEGLAELLGATGSMEPPALKERVIETLGESLDDDASLLVLEVL